MGLAKATLTPPASSVELSKLLQDATVAAERSGQASLVARAWLNMLNSSTEIVLDERSVDQALTQADWAISRLGDPPRLRAQWDDRAGATAWNRGHREEARRDFMLSAALSTSDPWLKRFNRSNLSRLAGVITGPADSVPGYAALVADNQMMDDMDARSRSDIHYLYALSLYQVGRAADAVAQQNQARDLLRGVVPDDDPRLFDIDTNLATALASNNQPKDAIALMEHDLPLINKILGPDHLLAGRAYDAEANADLMLSDFTAAIKHSDRAVEILSQRLGRQSGECLVSRQRALEARRRVPGDHHSLVAPAAEMVADAEKTFGAGSYEWGQMVGPYGSLLLEVGEKAKAIEVMEHVVAVMTEKNVDPANTAQDQLFLAILVAPTDKKRAIALAEAAQEAWKTRADFKEQLNQVDSWLRELKRH